MVPPTTTPVARPFSTTTRSTGAPVTTCPPSARNRVASASLSRPAPPSGTGKADRLPEHGQQQTDQPRPGRRGGEIGVRRVAGHQHPRPATTEDPAGHRCVEGVLRGREEPVHEVEATDARQLQRSSQPVADGWHRGEQGGDQRRSDPAPLVDQGQPGGPVTRVLTLQQVGGHGGIAMQQRPGAVGPGVPEHRGRVPPAQPVRLQAESGDHRRRRRHRVEGAEGVVDEVGVHVSVAAHRTADVGLGLDQQHLPAGVGQQVRRHQTVRPGAHHHGVDRPGEREGAGGSVDEPGAIMVTPSHRVDRRSRLPRAARMTGP